MTKPTPTPEPTTHFGYKTVEREAKETLVRGVFDHVARRYDIMNDLMSGGLHRWWKHELVNTLSPNPQMDVLDLAGGTGDVAFAIREHSLRHSGAAPRSVTVSDINEQMLEEGRKRMIDRGLLNDDLAWLPANAEALPLEDGCMDAVTMAFGIRNVTNTPQALSEIFRVLRPGGRFLCLEFSEVKNPLLARAYDLYSFNVIPSMGKMVTGSADPYQYLVESIRQFPNQEAFAAMLRTAGFAQVTYRNYTGGVVAIHSGWKV